MSRTLGACRFVNAFLRIQPVEETRRTAKRWAGLAILIVSAACSQQEAAPLPEPKVLANYVSVARKGAFPRWVEGRGGRQLTWIREDGPVSALHWNTVRGVSVEGRAVATGQDWFVNWADRPVGGVDPSGARIATWLVKNGESTYAYEVVFAIRPRYGSWSSPRPLHQDRSATEHGFVSLVALDSGWCGVWLDGRHSGAGGHDGGGEGHDNGHAGAMMLLTRTIAADGELGPEVRLDGRVCDCCPTDATRLDDGTVVVVYRDRGLDERRDIAVVRGVPENPRSWTEPERLHDDGWVIAGCPVNGPAIDSDGQRVAVAWFTLGDSGRARVNVALSVDGGRTFAAPIEVDHGDPVGRVDLTFLPRAEGTDVLVVSWLEGDGWWLVRGLAVEAVLRPGPTMSLCTTSTERRSGILQLARSAMGVSAAWTVPTDDEVRVWIADLSVRFP